MDSWPPNGWTPSQPHYPPGMSPHEHLMLTRILEQGERTERRLIQGDFIFHQVWQSLGAVQREVAELRAELAALKATWQRERLRRRLPCWASLGSTIQSTLSSLFTPRQWLGIAVVSALSLKGIISPEQMQGLALNLIGLKLP